MTIQDQAKSAAEFLKAQGAFAEPKRNHWVLTHPQRFQSLDMTDEELVAFAKKCGYEDVSAIGYKVVTQPVGREER